MKKQNFLKLRERSLMAATGILLAASLWSRAATTLFSENFIGSRLNPLWVATLPTEPIAKGDPVGPEIYAGAPNYTFATVDHLPVLRMNTTLAPAQRVGWSLNTRYHTSDFRYEVRFNTLTQSPDASIDAFIEIWILDANDPTRYDLVSPFGGNYDSDPSFIAGSSISGLATDQSFTYQDNAFYRLVLHGSTNENVRAAICDDNGKELIGYDLGHTTAAYSNGFTIGLSQAVDRPVNNSATDVAVASVALTTGDTTITPQIKQAIQISWPTVAGRSYQLQTMVPGRMNEWTNVGEPVAGTGQVMDFLEPQQNFKAFYRIQMLP